MDLGQTAAANMECEYFGAPETMLADERIKAVIVSTPTGLHEKHGVAVLSAGKHLLCEKPLTHSMPRLPANFMVARLVS